MAIFGTGIDLVAIHRFTNNDKSKQLAKRVLHDSEFALYLTKQNQSAYLAKRFAAKEAVAKAFGTGIGALGWHNIIIKNTDNGAPFVELNPSLKSKLPTPLQQQSYKIHISITDDQHYAMSQAIIELL